MPKKTVKKKTKSLDEFVEEIKQDIEKFAEAYRKDHVREPEYYPLEIPINNSGLWFEFFTDFCTDED